MSSFIVASALSCALGSSLQKSVENLRDGAINLSSVALDNLEDPIEVPYFGIPNPDLLPTHELMYRCVSGQVESVIETLGLTTAERSRTGLFFGSSSFTVADSEQQYFSELARNDVNALPMPIAGYNKFPERIAAQFSLSACVHSYATACTSSANALIYADFLIALGEIDHAIVIGCEFKNTTTLLGFYGVELLSPQRRMLPFDRRRDGLILGEACATLVLSKERKSNGLVFKGGACNTDTFSLTAANTDGSSITNVISDALKASGCNAGDVSLIKVHGTASLLSDEAESAGILRVFDKLPPILALKPYIGHTLGACGAVELALLAGATIEGSFVPSNPGIAVADEGLGLTLLQDPLSPIKGHYLLNYFAFGGNNVSLVIENAK